jgi:hypothetical protein
MSQSQHHRCCNLGRLGVTIVPEYCEGCYRLSQIYTLAPEHCEHCGNPDIREHLCDCQRIGCPCRTPAWLVWLLRIIHVR